MPLPSQVNSRLIHFKKQLLLLAKLRIFTVVLLCQLFCFSRNTFYKYRRRERAGNLGYISSAPVRHGRKKSAAIVSSVLAARERFPHYGKRRIASYLNSEGISICANTVPSILKGHNKALPKRKRKKRCWRFFEAIAPKVLWSIDICSLYTQKHHGFNLYFITILDDHSRYAVPSGLFEQATVVEVVAVLKDAVSQYGVPQTIVCDNGSQFTCREFRRVCSSINLEIDYAPKHYPRYKAKLERFFRTTREEMALSETIEQAKRCHHDWIDYYNHHRIHSGVIDAGGKQHSPFCRFTWKESLATPLSEQLGVDAIFSVHGISSAPTRKVNAQRQIRYGKKLYTFGQLNKGDVVKVSESKESISFYYQEKLLRTYHKPVVHEAGETRQVKADGKVKFHHQYYQLQKVSKGDVVVITRASGKLHFFLNGELLLITLTMLN